MDFMKEKKGLILVILTAIISGFSIFINSYGVKEFDSSIFTFTKNVLVALLLFSVIFAFGNISELKTLKRKNWLQLIIIGLVGGSIPFLLFFEGLKLTTGTTSAFIHKTLFIYATIFALIFLKEKLNKGILVGAGLLLLGNFLMIKPDFKFSVGHLLILIAAILWAIENTYAKHVLKNVSGNVVAFGRMFFGSAFILIYLVISNKVSLLGKLTSTHLFWIIISSGFLLMYVLTYYNGLKHIKVSTATSILVLGSVITTTLNIMFKGTAITILNAGGMLTIVIGALAVIWFSEIQPIKAGNINNINPDVAQDGRS